MTHDPTESLRRKLVEHGVADRCAEAAEKSGEPTWTTEELQRDFEVLGFLMPMVVVRRRADGVMGCLMFRHSPRLYFGWQKDQNP
jgi:hypothetical protein